MDDNIQNMCLKSMDLLEQNLSTILSNLPGDNTKLKEEFSSLYDRYCKTDLELSAHKEAVEHIKSLQADKEEVIEAEYSKKFAEVISNLPSPKNHSRYMSFDSKLGRLVCRPLDFDGINSEQQDSETQRLDPFTKKPIETAVKNKYCGHLYEKDSIQQMLQIHSKLHCPVVGCKNKKMFSVQDLVNHTDDVGTLYLSV